jgi:hypothetical protein
MVVFVIGPNLGNGRGSLMHGVGEARISPQPHCVVSPASMLGWRLRVFPRIQCRLTSPIAVEFLATWSSHVVRKSVFLKVIACIHVHSLPWECRSIGHTARQIRLQSFLRRVTVRTKQNRRFQCHFLFKSALMTSGIDSFMFARKCDPCRAVDSFVA